MDYEHRSRNEVYCNSSLGTKAGFLLPRSPKTVRLGYRQSKMTANTVIDKDAAAQGITAKQCDEDLVRLEARRYRSVHPL
jgi:hypothetical protein